jgi:hypothetical protein
MRGAQSKRGWELDRSGRHEIAGAEGEAINLRWENEIQQASEELRQIIGGR